MTNQLSIQKETTADGISPNLRAWGTRSWLYLGIALWVFVIITFLTAISGLVVPLVVAVIIAMLAYPLVDRLAARRINRTLVSLLVILLVIAILAGTVWVTWVGIFSQSDEMVAQIEAGLMAFSDWASLNLPAGLVEQIQPKLFQAASGLASFIFSGFSGAISFFFGGFTAFFLLFYLLADWHNVSDWVGHHLGAPGELGVTFVADAAAAIRIYFYALTLANLPVAAAVGITMWLLGLPLAVPVALVTLVTSFIPYLGAFLSGAFAALVALGAGGIVDVVIILGVILGLQNILDPIITNHITSDKLEMHPIVTLMTTLGGGILFGALGAVLANPVTAVLIDVSKRLQVYHAEPPAGSDLDRQQRDG